MGMHNSKSIEDDGFQDYSVSFQLLSNCLPQVEAALPVLYLSHRMVYTTTILYQIVTKEHMSPDLTILSTESVTRHRTA